MAVEDIFKDGVHAEIRGSSGVITLSNPGRRNAFYPEMRQCVIETIEDFNANAAVRTIVITGADGHFCAGADLKRVAQRTDFGPLQVRSNFSTTHKLLQLIVGGDKPVIAAVEGDAFGAGFSMAVACDVVIASETARFGASFAKIGLLPDMGLLYTLPQRMGMPAAKRLMMLAETVDGRKAAEAGIADEAVAPGKAMDRALEWADKFADSAPMSLAFIKSAFAQGIGTLQDAMEAELNIVPLLATSDDHKAALAAFAEKRPFSFRPK
jgi:enoyl-CoA hydratase/carnithine racemase